ncbi:MAG: AAA family ATPase [Candidatus Aenigmarchaeota archaeon]|nr:AAA family ATPase [Candidatus Aenigmarchaeota archaeon]
MAARNKKKSRKIFDVEKIKKEIKKVKATQKKEPNKMVVERAIEGKKREYIRTGIEGFDELFEYGIPKGSAVLIAGGAGSGKTILCLQIVANAAKAGEKCLYMSFEESEKRLKQHMEDFGWNPRELEKKGRLIIKRMRSHDIARSVEALLAKERGELMIDIDPIILPEGFKPDRIVVDSLSAIASSFIGKERNYRSYIEQLFRYFEKLGATSFLITETEQVPKIFSPTGVEEFLADGVIVLYNIRKGNIRENAIEVLKLRGAKHVKKIVAMQIVDGKGIVVYPEQEVFTEIE